MEHQHQDNHHHSHHIVPIRTYINTLLALIVLTILTVAVSYVDFGKFNIVVSLGIATAKASLVMAFFMGLKYDNNINRGFILSSFVALFLMIFFSAIDLWTRKSGQPDPITVKASAVALGMEDVMKMSVASPDLVEKGKAVYDVNCAVCHGASGMGDGIGGAALNPKPRNFHGALAEWKNGGSFKAIYVTLVYGIPGSGMASYKALSPMDRITLTHYVRSLMPSAPDSSSADARFTAALTEDGIGEGAAAAPKTVLPIDFAIQQMIKN
ncbi:MAG: cytochrome C oxidase subunit IV family protein [Oligoflexia bacterium]|nr:cytochrome C oxidase subunit IV family protein [Oligoflexia bacterium]